MTHAPNANALSSDPKLFISADNTFYAYVKAGETISAAFNRVNQDEPFDTTREDITITLDGPGMAQQKCIAPKSVPIGQGCTFAAQAAIKTGIWKIQFAIPATARTYQEVSPAVRWAKNLFNWNITVKGASGEQHGRVWTERYAIRQPAADNFIGDFVNYYISEDGYIYRATNRGYNGQISTLSADSVGIRSGDKCVSAYQSTEVGDTKFSPALGACGNSYKLFFEEPAGDLPTKADKWDDTSDWVRPNISRPSVSELHFTSDKSADQQSGKITFYLRNFIGQYQIKIDVDNDGSFDGQSDVVLNQQMKKLSNGLQEVRFSGVDKGGQIISPAQIIGVKVDITKVAEIHLVAADVEGRVGGLELVRLSGDNAPTTRICWNDTELPTLADESLMTKTLDGRDCPDSTGGLHGWAYATSSWGNARYVEDWVYASAKLEGNNQITYPEEKIAAANAAQKNWWVVVLIVASVIVVGVISGVVISRKRRQKSKKDITTLLAQSDTGMPSDTHDQFPSN
ncbi:MAG: hypothetical protein JWN75_431 [Candidatus Saccharibacteria bacterium]|nr:hypothetical protein [Candidatus Saccharibacteria bacterium]